MKAPEIWADIDPQGHLVIRAICGDCNHRIEGRLSELLVVDRSNDEGLGSHPSDRGALGDELRAIADREDPQP